MFECFVVYAWINNRWQSACISKVWHTPRSYVVQTDDGEYRRNSSDIRKRFADEAVTVQQKQQQQTPMFTKRTRSGRQY